MKKLSFVITLFSLLFFAKESVLAAPTLNLLTPDQGAPGKEITVSGTSYCSGSQIIFYDYETGATEKASAPAVAYDSSDPSKPYSCPSQIPGGPAITASNFKFTVPEFSAIFQPGQYKLKLYNSLFGESVPLPFTVVPKVTGISPNEGNHDTLIIITGSNFATTPNSNQVYFEPGSRVLDVPAGYLPDRIIARIPLFSPMPFGSYTIKVFSNGPEADYAPTANRNFIFRPHLTNLLPSSGNTGSELTISGIYFSDNASIIKAIFYQGATKKGESPANSPLPGLTSFKTTVPAGLSAGNYTVKASVNGIESDNSFPFTVLPPPPADLTISSFTAEPSIVNLNTPVNFSVDVAGGTPPYSYNFNWGDNTTQDFNNPPFSHSYNTVGIYDVYATVTDGSSPKKETAATTRITVTTTPLPISASISAPGSARVREQFNITVTGQAPTGNLITSVVLYKTAGTPPVNPAENNSADALDVFSFSPTISPATKVFSRSESAPGIYKYFAKVSDNEGNVINSLMVTVNVSAIIGGPIGGPGGEPVCLENQICNPLKVSSFQALIDIFIKFIFWVALALAPLMVVVGAGYIITSQGDIQRVMTGKKIITYTIIGLAVILFARGLVSVLKGIIG